MKFCDVIAGAFGVSGCIPLRTVLRDVAIVVQFWCVSERIRLLSMISLFRFVVFFLQFLKHVSVETKLSSSLVGQRAPIEA